MKQFSSIITLSIFVSLSLLFGCDTPKFQDISPVSSEKHVPGIVEVSREAISKSGIQLITVENREKSSKIKAMGEIKADENQVFHISSIVTGRVVKDRVNLGDRIHQGAMLAVIQNQDIVKVQASSIHELHTNQVAISQAKARLDLAKQNFEREKSLYNEGVSPKKDYNQANAELRIAQAELAGLQEHNIHIKSEAKALLNTYGVGFHGESEQLTTGSPVIAPRSGIITKKNVTVGDVVSADQVLYEVSDLSRLWLDITIYPKDLSHVHLGQRIIFQSDSIPGHVFIGHVNFIQSNASEQSQTFLVRAFVNNANHLLKPGMYGQATIEQTVNQSLPFVSEDAVQTDGKETYVFLPTDQEGQYRKQAIVLDDKVDDGYLVKEGLAVGQKVVSKGSFTLKAELLKRQLGEDE